MHSTFFSYTDASTAGRSAWSRRAARLWFVVRTASLRARFLAGKASFIEADVRITTHNICDVHEKPGQPAQARLLSHFQLRTAAPRGGDAGWRLFDERVGGGTAHKTVALACRFCAHRFIVQVLSSIDPLADELTGSQGPGAPASFGCDWFRFAHERFSAPASLHCPRCEQRGEPQVSFWGPS